ncbi:lasso peptide biosynthesis B2 protein [Streptomyces sp. NPDC021100]|uniref:lasso peptide biosynthesis B2 protein n=1 Tax=Streptomyces sp. NPDC021100 TaxID=3365114 RepID=UPI0037B82E64
MPVSHRLYTTAITPGGAALLDIRRAHGRWVFLNPTGAALWQLLADGIPAETAIKELTAHWTGRGADPGQVQADLVLLTQSFAAARLDPATSAPTPVPAPGAIRFAPPGMPPKTADRLAGITGLAAALVLLRILPVRTVITVARAAARLPLPPATPQEADAVFAAVHRAARAWPGRAACFEESLGAFLAALLRRRRIHWVLGARFAPAAAHAWIETADAVIGQDEADRAWPYTPALRV